MIKHFCDRCGNELSGAGILAAGFNRPAGDNYFVKVSITRNKKDDLELCEDCIYALVDKTDSRPKAI